MFALQLTQEHIFLVLGKILPDVHDDRFMDKKRNARQSMSPHIVTNDNTSIDHRQEIIDTQIKGKLSV